MIYLDSSCLLKLLLSEPESEAVRQAVARERDVVVSALTEFETTVQLRAGRPGAVFGERRYRASDRSSPVPDRPAATVARWTGYTWRPWKSSGYAV